MGSKPRGISASRAGTVLGLNSFQTQFELWQRIMEEEYPGHNEKHGYTLPEDPDNASIRWGHAFEDAIVKLAEEQTFYEIIARERLYYYHPEFGTLEACKGMYTKVVPFGQYITCHIDGMFANNATLKKTLHEGKTTTVYQHRNEWGTPGTNRVPAYIQCQVQHQLLCTGADKCIVSVLVFPKRPDEWEAEGYEVGLAFGSDNDTVINIIIKYTHDEKQEFKYEDWKIPAWAWAKPLEQMGFFHQYPITADKNLQTMMISRYQAWWEKHIIGKTPPDPETYEDMRRYFPDPVGTIKAPDDLASLCKEYAMITKETGKKSRLSIRRENIKVKILSWMKEQDGCIDDDSREKTILVDNTGKKLATWDGRKFLCR